jgi:hypothetical protein
MPPPRPSPRGNAARLVLDAEVFDRVGTMLSTDFNAGVPAPEVASLTGLSVEVLWRVYVGCIYGHEQLWNRHIDEALAYGGDTETEPPDDHAS